MSMRGGRATIRRLRPTLVAGVASVVLGLLPGLALASTFATARPGELILLADPAAEIGPGAAGWSGTAGYTATDYGAAGEYPSLAVAESIAGGGSVGGGSRFFDPGYEPDAVLTQDVDLSRFAAQISSGELDALLAVGWLGGWGASPDTVDLVVTPLDASSAPLAAPTTVAGPSAAERGNVTQLVHRMSKLALPPATRGVRVELRATGRPGLKNHGYADEIVLVLTRTTFGVPRPDSAQASVEARPPVGRVNFHPATITVGRRAPGVRRSGRQLLVVPRLRVNCPRQDVIAVRCVVRVQVTSRDGTVIARSYKEVLPGTTLSPTARLRDSRVARAVRAGEPVPAAITVSADQRQGSRRPVSRSRTTTLRLR